MCGGVCGRETHPVLAAVGGGECEASLRGGPLVYDAVVVVEYFVDGYGDAEVGIGLVGFGIIVVLLGFERSFS